MEDEPEEDEPEDDEPDEDEPEELESDESEASESEETEESDESESPEDVASLPVSEEEALTLSEFPVLSEEAFPPQAYSAAAIPRARSARITFPLFFISFLLCHMI